MKIEAGKSYRRRNGEIMKNAIAGTGPLFRGWYLTSPDGAQWEYRSDGLPSLALQKGGPFDLVEEADELTDEAVTEMLIAAHSKDTKSDPVNHPPHYTEHLSGVECIQITEHMNFCLGNAVKYIWRADSKGKAVEDLKKAIWYLEREVARRETLDSLPTLSDVETNKTD